MMPSTRTKAKGLNAEIMDLGVPDLPKTYEYVI
jgi:hypothetical protein